MSLADTLDARINKRAFELSQEMASKLRRAAQEIADEFGLGIHGSDLIGFAAGVPPSQEYCHKRVRDVLADRLAKELIA